MILDRLILRCRVKILQAKALENNWALEDFLKYQTTKKVRRVAEKVFSRRKSQNIHSFRNRNNASKLTSDEERKKMKKMWL